MPYNPPRRQNAAQQGSDGHAAFQKFMQQANDSSASVASRASSRTSRASSNAGTAEPQKRRFYLSDNGSNSSVSSAEEHGSPLRNSVVNASTSSLSAPDPLPLATGFPNNRLGLTVMPSEYDPKRSPTENAAVAFTTTSPQSYSYALMSPNSMALRLKVLKRSLEILMERPEWLNSETFTEGLDTDGQQNPLESTETSTLGESAIADTPGGTPATTPSATPISGSPPGGFDANGGSLGTGAQAPLPISVQFNPAYADRSGPAPNRGPPTAASTAGASAAVSGPGLTVPPRPGFMSPSYCAGPGAGAGAGSSPANSACNSPSCGSPVTSPPMSPRLNSFAGSRHRPSMASGRLPSRRVSTTAAVMDNVFKLERIGSSKALSKALQTAQQRAREPPQASVHPPASTYSYKRKPPNAVTQHQTSVTTHPGTNSQQNQKGTQRHPSAVSAPPVIGSVSVDRSLLEDLKQIIHFLDSGIDPDLTADQASRMINMHNLSLTNAERLPKNQTLKIQLLHALATPFEEGAQGNNSVAGIPVLQNSMSSWGLSNIDTQGQLASPPPAQPPTIARQYHASSAGKTKSPKAIFTCEADSPWRLMNCNDLGCLMFGISRQNVKNLTLMDLIAPRSRNIVGTRLCRPSSQVFAGQVVAIKRNNDAMAWTSLWGKKKGNFIIMIFEQIPCDSIDLTILKGADEGDKFNIETAKTNSALFTSSRLEGKPLKKFVQAMDVLVETKKVPSNYRSLPESQKDTELINKVRYFTLSPDGGNSHVPCASASEELEPDEDGEIELRLNIHSLPYMAGSFVVSSNGYKIVAFNEAIAKNLFGRADLTDMSVSALLPTFRDLIEIAINENPGLMYEAGLVLPEHYFRKIDAYRRGTTEDEKELLFMQSTGISGLHNDGHEITVDVQMRIIDQDYFLLWITYCRAVGLTVSDSKSDSSLKDITASMETQMCIQENEDEEKAALENKEPKVIMDIPAHVPTLSQGSTARVLDDDRVGDVPSQLPLFDAHRGSIESTGGSSAEMSRSSTMESDQSTSTSSSFDFNSSNTSLPMSEVSSKDFRLNNVLTQKQMLAKEAKEIGEIRRHSKAFPSVVGAERRTKKVGDFHVLKNLGQGAYGKVVVAEHNGDPWYKIVLKAIFKDRILVDTWVRDKKLGTIPSEIQILNAVNKEPHPNVMRIVDFFEDDKCYYLETLQHGDPPAVDLFDLIEVKPDMSEFECKYIYYQCCSALYHLHKKGIVHRDIKDENIIVDKDFIVKLIDFGSAAYTKDGPFGVFVGTIDYAAPEVLNGMPYDGKPQDVWAMGVLLYTLVFKENPFTSVDEILEGNLTFPMYKSVSQECMDLIKSILVDNYNERPSMKDILQSKWLEGFH